VCAIFCVDSATPFSRYPSAAFFAGWAALLILTGIYTGAVLTGWAETPLGQSPQGEARAWLAEAESLHDDTAAREPFFRAPAYPTLLAVLRDAGVTAADLPDVARMLNGLAHVAATALVALLGWRLWKHAGGALLAGVLWGFYPPAIFLAAEPGPETLALLVWLGGAAAALGGVWRSPAWQGGRRTRRHFWAYPLVAGVAFALAAVLYAPWWPAALAWPLVALAWGEGEARGMRLVSATAGVGLVAIGVMILQDLWGGSPQPLAGADLYRLALATQITQPWAAPLPLVEMREDLAGADALEAEASFVYHYETEQDAPGSAVLAGYWWRRAVVGETTWPLRSGLRVMRKAYQFFSHSDYGAGPDLARAKAESGWLRYNPLGWPVVLVMGGVGLVLGWRRSAARLAVVLVGLASAGALLWYPTTEARAPAAAVLAVLSGGWLAGPWPRGVRAWLALSAWALGLVILPWLPRPQDPAARLTARDARQRAMAWASLGQYNEALAELVVETAATGPSSTGKELAESWRFARMLATLPTPPPRAELETQMLDNAEAAQQSHAAQFRSGVCLWLLGQHDGALFYWRGLASQEGAWAAEARAAIAATGQETPDETQRRVAWELGGAPPTDPTLAPLLAYWRAQTAKSEK
jgi:hypothetical protein